MTVRAAVALAALLLAVACGSSPAPDAGADAGVDAGPTCTPPAVAPQELCIELPVGRPCDADWAGQAYDGGSCGSANISQTACDGLQGFRSEYPSGLGPTNECYYRDAGLVGTRYRSDVGTAVAGLRPTGCAWTLLCGPDAGP